MPSHPLHTKTQEMLSNLIPEDDSTPVIEGVCAWLLDMGILDGNDDEVLERIHGYANEARLTEPYQTPEEFLEHLFRDEYCAECGGDAEHHAVLSNFPFMGTFFAKCKFEPDDEGNWHPVIRQFREEEDEEHRYTDS